MGQNVCPTVSHGHRNRAWDAPVKVTTTPKEHAMHSIPTPTAPARCADHPAFDADYCPVCGTATVIRTDTAV